MKIKKFFIKKLFINKETVISLFTDNNNVFHVHVCIAYADDFLLSPKLFSTVLYYTSITERKIQ